MANPPPSDYSVPADGRVVAPGLANLLSGVDAAGAANLRTPIGEAEQLYAALKWLGVDTALVT